GLRLAAREPLGSPSEEGYLPTGRRVFHRADRPATDRAVDMLLRKIHGERYTTEWEVPRYSLVPPAPPLHDPATAKIALVTTGGLAPTVNPDPPQAGHA